MQKFTFLSLAAATVALATLPGHAATYNVTLTQQAGTNYLTSMNFTTESAFTFTPTSGFSQDTVDLAFKIGSETFYVVETIQFNNGSPTNYYENSYTTTASGDEINTINGGQFNLSGNKIGDTDRGSVTIAIAATPLPSALPLFAGSFGAFAFFMFWRRNRISDGFVRAAV